MHCIRNIVLLQRNYRCEILHLCVIDTFNIDKFTLDVKTVSSERNNVTDPSSYNIQLCSNDEKLADQVTII